MIVTIVLSVFIFVEFTSNLYVNVSPFFMWFTFEFFVTTFVVNAVFFKFTVILFVSAFAPSSDFTVAYNSMLDSFWYVAVVLILMFFVIFECGATFPNFNVNSL